MLEMLALLLWLQEHLAFKGTPQVGTSDYLREAVVLDQLDEGTCRQIPSESLAPVVGALSVQPQASTVPGFSSQQAGEG